MAAPPSPNPAALMDELVEDCLLRLPPDDPADLARAALVSKQWHRVVTGAIFRRRYIEFHRRSAPLLGYIDNLDNDSIRFVPTSSFRPPQADRRDGVRAVHSRHGRVLLCSARVSFGLRLLVWDPRKDKQWELPVLQRDTWIEIHHWDAALVCAGGDGCTHLDCHFKVVVVLRSPARRVSCFYCASEAVSWSDPIFVSEEGGYSSYCCCYKPDTVFVGNAFYFNFINSIFKLDLQTRQVCQISRGLPVSSSLLFATEDGSTLGLAKIIINSTLCVWLWEQGRWVESRLIQLRGLLPDDGGLTFKVVGFSETGAGVIFLRTCVGLFAIDLNSGRSKRIGNDVLGSGHIVPYVSFCTPAPGTVSTDVGPGASGVVSYVLKAPRRAMAMGKRPDA